MSNSETTSSPESKYHKTFTNQYKPKAYFMILPIFVVITSLFVFFGLHIMQNNQTTTPAQNAPQVLLQGDDTEAKAMQTSPSIPNWLMMLVMGFIVMQIVPVLLAARKARSPKLTQKILKEITFYCETPMYLGLLGSLVGVSMTQFITGSLAAPVAYTTTIAGILLHLLARFTIIVPLPTPVASD